MVEWCRSHLLSDQIASKMSKTFVIMTVIGSWIAREILRSLLSVKEETWSNPFPASVRTLVLSIHFSFPELDG